jgi:hypothetical protein
MKNSIYKTGGFLLLLILITSCNVDVDDEASVLGSWIETAPVPDRTSLVFEDHSRVTITDGDGITERFNYRIGDRKLILTIPGGGGTFEIFFEQINTNKIKTGNLYPSIPEDDPVFIIFERGN